MNTVDLKNKTNGYFTSKEFIGNNSVAAWTQSVAKPQKVQHIKEKYVTLWRRRKLEGVVWMDSLLGKSMGGGWRGMMVSHCLSRWESDFL